MAEADKLIDDLATWVNARLAARATVAKATVAKVVDGEYKGDDLAADLGAAWALVAEDVTTFLGLLPGAAPTGPGGPGTKGGPGPQP